jgi:2'-5' RNA ligase
MQSKIERCNIVILPKTTISERAIRMSRLLKKCGGVFFLDHRSHIPHITLYMTDFPKEKIPAIVPLLRNGLRRAHPVVLKASAYRVKKDGFIDVCFKQTPAARNLQRIIVERLNPLRGGIPAHQERFREFSGRERANIVRYGYPEIAGWFRPHLTFTRLARQKKKRTITFPLHINDFSFIGTHIGIFLAGPHNTCRKIIAKFLLKISKIS